MAGPQGTLSIPDTTVTSITFLTHEVFSISDIFESFTLLGGQCLYNYCLSIIFSILGEELMTASCKHDLFDKRPSAHEILTQVDKYILSLPSIAYNGLQKENVFILLCKT